MSNTYNNVVIYNGYPLSVVVAVIFHCLILLLLLYIQNRDSSQSLQLIQPTVVKALLVEENPQVQNQERQRLERIAEQQRSQEREQQREAEAARQEEEEQRQRTAEELRQQQLREQQQREEREQAQQRQADLERERNAAETERQRQREAERLRQERSREIERQRQQEAAEAAAAEVAQTEFEQVQSATALIQRHVQDNWSRPPSARNGMQAILRIRMLPTGEVTDVTITQSSGDPAFDRSAENAVFRAEPFRELQVLPTNIFNANFRVLSLIFQPEDLLN